MGVNGKTPVLGLFYSNLSNSEYLKISPDLIKNSKFQRQWNQLRDIPA